MNEKEIVRRLRSLFSPRIGDDAAVVGDGLVVTTDMLVEDVDFRRATPLRFVARKALAVNLSDLAAMGARPAWALCALALPEWVMPELETFLQSLAEAARQHGIEIVGGDLSRSEKLVVSITAAGRPAGAPLLRSGAQPGQRIYLSRPLGGSASGLTLLNGGWTSAGEPPREVGFTHREFGLSAIGRHLDPEPETALGVILAESGLATACIDVSDGLSSDLHHLCEASQCGAEIERDRIPLFPDLLGSGPALGINVREAVLHGGEELALLFTSTLRESELSARAGRPVYAIGRITAERQVLIGDESGTSILEPRGWDHFMSSRA